MKMETTCFSLSHKGIYTWVHYNVFDKTGWKHEELIGRSFLDFLSKKDHPLILQEMGKQSSGRTQVYLVNGIWKDGTEHPVKVSIRWFPENIVGSIDYGVTNESYQGIERRDFIRTDKDTPSGEPTPDSTT